VLTAFNRSQLITMTMHETVTR